MFPSFNITQELPEQVKAKLGGNISALPVEDKIHHIMAWLAAFSRVKSNTMLYMIMYDIENNRIRTNIAKYLIRKGCLRIQKSVYLAKSSPALMREISETLKEINEIYENEDSIFVLPVPEEKFSNIKVIGRNVEFEVITSPRNVLFF